MAINKAKSSPVVKIVLIFLIIAFVTSFISLSGVFSGTPAQTPQQGGGADPLATVNAQYRPTVQALTAQLQSDPASYTVLVSLGNTYFDWAAQTQQASQTSTAVAGADQPLWVAAKDAYRRAVDVKSGEPPVMVDYAIVTFYTGDTNEAIKLAESVSKSSPEFAPAWFNLGIFYGAVGQNQKGVAAFERYLKLDPQGKQGDPNLARQRITDLKSGGNGQTATPTTPDTGTAPATPAP